MKKIGILLLALILTLGIFAAPVYAAQETSSDVKLIYNVGENYKYPADERFAVSVRSVDELALFLEHYPFSQKIAYDEAFFAENTLLFVRLPQSTEKMVLTSVSETDTAIMVELETEVNDSELSGFNIYDETLTWALMFERDIDLPEKEVIVNSEKVADASYETITDRIQESLINVTSFSSDIWDSSEGMYVEEIYSTDELEQFFDKYPTSYPEKSANKLREKYDEAFFEENMVVFDCMAYSERFISAVTETEDAIEIEVVSPRTPPEPVNIPWVLVIEIDLDMPMKEIVVNSKKIADAPDQEKRFKGAELIFLPVTEHSAEFKPQAMKIRSVDELDRFFNQYCEGYSLKDKYDENFFDEKRLLVMPFTSSGSFPGYEITSMKEDDWYYNRLVFEIKAIPSDFYTDDSVIWMLLYETDKEHPREEISINLCSTWGNKIIDYLSYEIMPVESEVKASLYSTFCLNPDYDYAFKVCSVDDLKQYAEHCWFNEQFLKEHDEEFFEEKTLFFAYIGTYDCADKFEIFSIDETTGKIELKLEKYNYYPAPTHIYDLILILEMDRDMPEREICVDSKMIAEAPYKTVTFADVPSGAWYADAVKYVSWDRNIMNGSNNLFNPQGTMTRGMLVTVLWRLAGEPETETNVFTDVPEGKYYTEAVNWAAENGIVTGSGDNKFNPEGAITREQLVTILYRMAVKKGTASGTYEEFSGFEDDEAVRGYAVEAMKWAVSEGIITGSENGGKLYLNPQKNSTRAQVAAILMRYLK